MRYLILAAGLLLAGCDRKPPDKTGGWTVELSTGTYSVAMGTGTRVMDGISFIGSGARHFSFEEIVPRYYKMKNVRHIEWEEYADVMILCDSTECLKGTLQWQPAE
jgi:hypothetical protein